MASTPQAQDFKGIIDTLRFFAESRRLGVVDRVGLALSTDAVREALYEALRTIKALEQRKVTFKLKSGEREFEVTCCEYDELEEGQACPSSTCGKVVELVSGDLTARKYRGKTVWCSPCPRIPDEEELNRFFQALEDPFHGLRLAREVSALALSWRRRR